MDDIGLAMGASPEIGRLYKQAKTFSAETPVLALSFLRGLAVVYCKLLDRDLDGRTLEEKILNLDRQGMLKPHVRRLLRVLQVNGNKGAHPESYDFETLDFPALADEAITAARSLIEHLYEWRDGEVPRYEIALAESGALKEMCVLAMLERDVNAMNQAGLYFKERADREKQLDGYVGPDGYPFGARGDIDQAMFWFKQAADAEHTGAMYQYGHYLVQHHNVDKDRLRDGQRYIARSARDNNADALVYVGNASLEGLGIFEKDEAYAREVFMEAAKQGHPIAWTQLGAMHLNGTGGAADPDAAAKYTLAAARAGNPHAQYNLCALYLEGAGVPKDVAAAVRSLQEAASQGHPDAIYSLAKFIEIGEVPGCDPAEAEEVYEQAMEYQDYRARSALYAAKLIDQRSAGMTDLLKAAKYLQECFSMIEAEGDPHKLRADCLTTCQKVVGRIRAHLNDKGPDAALRADDIFTSALFSKTFIPVLDRRNRWAYLSSVIRKNGRSDRDATIKFLMHEACLTYRPPVTGFYFPGLKTERHPPVTTRPSTVPVSTGGQRPGRNDPCPCGSGSKFKKCHGA